MKHFYLSLVCLFCFAGIALAQPPQGGGPQGPPPGGKMDMTKMAQMRADQMAKELSLNAQQKAAVLKLFKESAPKMMPGGPRGEQKPGDMKKGTPPTKPKSGNQPPKNSGQQPPQGGDDMHKQMEAQQKAFDAKLQKILTPAQYQKYLKNETSRRQHGGPGPRM